MLQLSIVTITEINISYLITLIAHMYRSEESIEIVSDR